MFAFTLPGPLNSPLYRTTLTKRTDSMKMTGGRGAAKTCNRYVHLSYLTGIFKIQVWLKYQMQNNNALK